MCADGMLEGALSAYQVSNVPQADNAAQQLLSALPGSLRSQLQALQKLLSDQYALHALVMLLFLRAAAQQPSSSEKYPAMVSAGTSGSARAGHQCLTCMDAIRDVVRGIPGTTAAQRDVKLPAILATVVLDAQKLQAQLLGELLRLWRGKLNAAVTGNNSHAGSVAQGRAYIRNLEVAIDSMGTYMGHNLVSFLLPVFEQARTGSGSQGGSSAAGAGPSDADADAKTVTDAARVCGQICSVLENNVRLWLELAALGHVVESPEHVMYLVAQLLHPRQTVQSNTIAACSGSRGAGAVWEPILAAGSRQQRQQLLGLCCSALKKRSNIHHSSSDPAQPDKVGRSLTRAVCLTATQVIKAATGNTDTTPFVLRQVRPGHWSSGPTSVLNTQHSPAQLQAGSSSSSGGGMKAVGLLPWLALIGRCFTLWALEMQGYVAEGFGTAPHVFSRRVPARPALARRAAVELFQGFRDLAVGAAVAVREALAVQEYSAALTAAGYDVQGVAERVSREIVPVVIRALQALDNNPADSDTVGRVLADVCGCVGNNGLGYVNLAFPSACNNPTCSNVSGPSEAELVVGGNRR